MTFLRTTALLTLAAAAYAQAPSFDRSGQGLLNGRYNFRNVVWTRGSANGDLSAARAAYGTITFDGNGNYSMEGSVFDSGTTAARAFTFRGDYVISASGLGFIASPQVSGGLIHGTVSRGIFIGSTTESNTNDLFVAAPAGTTANSDFSGAWVLSEFGYPTARASEARSALARFTANGNGTLGTANVAGFIGTGAQVTTFLSNVTYSFLAGVGTLNWGGAVNALTPISGRRTFYMNADRDFIFGGSPDNFDFFIGIRPPAGNVPPGFTSGLFYNAGAQLSLSNAGEGVLRTHMGSVRYVGTDVLGHRRRYRNLNDLSQDYTYHDRALADGTGLFQDLFGQRHLPSADGNFLLSYGNQRALGVGIAVKAPDFSGPGVFINPTGVVNAASNSPFTLGLARGELVTIFGSGLASQLTVDTNFPRQVAGVQVLFNGRPGPIYYVAPTQVAAIVPYDIPASETFVNVEVVNNGARSNAVSLFVRNNAAGLFTTNQQGFGIAAALHQDGFSVVTPANPARLGEVISVFLSGMGIVDPPVTEGALGPVNPLSLTAGEFVATVDGQQAPVFYSGLAPQLRGLYQLNVRIPAATNAGNVFLDIAGPGSFNTQAQIPVTRANPIATAVAPASVQRIDRAEGIDIPLDAKRK